MKINISDTGLLQPLTQDYLHGLEALRPLYSYPPKIAFVEKAINAKKADYSNRSVLVKALLAQYSSVEASLAVVENINLLSSADTFTVTTAHQPNIFGGPLYFIVKILSAVSTAKYLQRQYPQYNFIPVYWMGSEDHDAAELNNINLYTSNIEWAVPSDGAFGRLPTATLAPLIDQISALLDNTMHKAEVEKMLRECYLDHTTVANATRALVNALFGKYGVVTVDGDDAVLKGLYKQVIKDELTHQSSKRLADESSKILEALGYTPQAFARPVNLFYLDKTIRSRIEVENGIYTILLSGKTLTTEQILDLVDKHPERFSPNVILRGLYQETVLPNVIFIGGGAEVSYWLQLQKIFEYHKVPFPIIMLRDSALIIEPSFVEKWGALGFDLPDLFKDETQLVKNFMDRQTDVIYTDYTIEAEIVSEAFAKIRDKIGQIDKTLMPATEAEFVKVRQIIDGLSNRGAKALKRRYDASIQSIKSNKHKFFPGGVFQERHFSFLQWYARFGSIWFDTLIEEFNPFDKALTIIEL